MVSAVVTKVVVSVDKLISKFVVVGVTVISAFSDVPLTVNDCITEGP